MAALIQKQDLEIQRQAEQVQGQAEQICKLNITIGELKDEISRLNKTPKRPKFKPNQMEPRNRGKRSSPSTQNERHTCAPNKEKEEVKVVPEEVPEGSRFKGYTEFTVQDVEIKVTETTYKLEVWVAPDGKIIRAKLPEELRGKHFGIHLRTLVINLYAQGMTQYTEIGDKEGQCFFKWLQI